MPDRPTERAVAEPAPLETACRLADELGPRRDAIVGGIELIRREQHV
jgi:hypothetical protein